MDGVAIAGELVTVNLGIEKIILNTISNPNIRFLMLCGKESPVFHPAQALQCLFEKGIDDQRRIKEAEGHYPVLNNIGPDQIEQFRQQLALIDCTGERDAGALRNRIFELALQHRSPFSEGPSSVQNKSSLSPEKQFRKIRPGGRRGTPTYDPNGFFIITVDHEAGKIVLQHYLQNNTPAHEMLGRRAESMMRGLVREELISQLSHAGYLGVELAKAETALRLGLDYEQDHPLKKSK
jgi:tetrahydromethanopterin S-methyltransferase subunit A